MVEPLVSAVTIVRDGERFLDDALNSVLGQTYRNLELVVVDDGSTDRSAEIAERFARAAPDRVRLVRHADGGSRGMSAARTLGVRTAQGELIGFLDADDVWLPEKIAEQVAVLEAHPAAGMVYGRTQMWYSWAANAGRSDYSYDLGVVPDRLYPPLRLLPLLLENRAQSPTTCNALMRREAYEKAGGFEETFPGLYEDQVFFAKLYVRSATYVSSRLWARYRRHEANEPRERFSYARYYRDRRSFLEWLAGYLRDAQVNGEVRAMLAAELTRARHPYRAALAARLRPAAPAIEPSARRSAATVSVIVAFRDANAHLDQAIASVKAQEHDRFELILVDDGSTDASTQIAREAATRDPERIRYLDHPGHANLGKSSSRNAGLRAARGEYVVFLDADDLLLPGKLAHQAAFLDAERGVDAVYGRTWYWDESGEVGRARERLSRLWVRWGATQEPPDLLVRFLEQPGSVPCLCALMARREVLLRLGGFDESMQDLYEDQTLIAKLALHCRIRVDAVPGERYRQHEGSSTRRAIREGTYHPWRPNAARRRYLDWLERYSAQLETPPSRPLSAALARAARPYRHPRAYRVLAPPAHGWQFLRERLVVLMRPEPRAEAGGMNPPDTKQWDWGDLRRLQPVSREFGYDRGLPIDRYYIERFLEMHRRDVTGRTLEIGDDEYTRRYGGNRTTRRDVLHVHGRNRAATIVGDLADAPQIADGTFDCIVVTQTLHLIYDVDRAVATLHRILRTGGVVLATFPGISQLSEDEWSRTWSWGFDSRLARRLFANCFGEHNVTVEAHGNSLAAVAFLQGLATVELTPAQLDVEEAGCELLVAVRAVR